MVKKVLLLIGLLLLCSSCVSRTTYQSNDLDGSSKVIEKKELIWFWNQDL